MPSSHFILFSVAGTPVKLLVRHDNSGLGPGWCLSRIEMHNLKEKVVYTFTPPKEGNRRSVSFASNTGGDGEDAESGVWLTKEKGLSAELVVSKVQRNAELVKYVQIVSMSFRHTGF